MGNTRVAVASVSLTVVLGACGGTGSATDSPAHSSSPTPATESATGTATEAQSAAPALRLLPNRCTDARPCKLDGGVYAGGSQSVLPGMKLTLPAGWSSAESSSGALSLIPPDRADSRVIVWGDMVAVKSSGAGHGTILTSVGTTPSALITWLTTNPDFTVVTPPAPAVIGDGIKATSLVIGVSHSAQYGDSACPSNPRCADLLTVPGHLGDNAYGIGGDGEVRIYIAPTTGGGGHMVLVALDASYRDDLWKRRLTAC